VVRVLQALMLAVLLFGGCKEDPPDVQGKKLYGAACAKCHGETGEGGVTPAEGANKSRDLSNASWQAAVTDEEMRQVIRDGRGAMPAFGNVFSIDKIDNIVKHVRTLKKAK
jgi:mono/diheme cytochrome c family protein